MERWLRWLVAQFDQLVWAVLWCVLMVGGLGVTYKVGIWVMDAISPCLGLLVIWALGILVVGGIVTVVADAGELKRIRAQAAEGKRDDAAL